MQAVGVVVDRDTSNQFVPLDAGQDWDELQGRATGRRQEEGLLDLEEEEMVLERDLVPSLHLEEVKEDTKDQGRIFKEGL